MLPSTYPPLPEGSRGRRGIDQFGGRSRGGGTRSGGLCSNRGREPETVRSTTSCRGWNRISPPNHPFHAIAADGVPPSLDASRLFLVEGTVLQPIDPRTGRVRWSVDLGGPPEWVAYLADKIVAATPYRVVALDVNQGTTIWIYEPTRLASTRPGPDPFAKAEALADPRDPVSPSELKLHAFEIMRDRVYFLQGDLRFIALDGDNGQVQWSFSSTAGSLDHRFSMGTDRIVIQAQAESASHSGSRGWAYDLKDFHDRCRRLEPPVRVDDSHVVIVSDRRTVKLLDLNKGEIVWVYRESADLPVNGPPRVLGNADCLLVLHDGRTLIRLDPLTGAKRWSRLLGTEDLSERPDSVAFDAKRFYCVEKLYGPEKRAQILRAFSLADGSQVWANHLTGRESVNVDWAIFLSDRYIIAMPVRSDLAEGESDCLPVVIRLRESGKLVQRLLFPSAISEASFRARAWGSAGFVINGFLGSEREALRGGVRRASKTLNCPHRRRRFTSWPSTVPSRALQ